MLNHRPCIPGPEDVHAFPNGFSQRLNQMGVVQPNPTYSPSSTVLRQQSASDHGNLATFGDRLKATHRREPLLSTFASRHQLQKQAEAEYETSRPAVDKRFRFMDMRQLLDALRLRENNVAQASIEQRLGLNPGLLTKLGRPGILSHVSTPSKDQI